MLQRFISNVTQQHLFPTGQQVLLAVSGGVDSVVLAHLMYSAGYPFAVAHCNFNLRPGDCDRDEAFVRRLARRYRVPFHLARFDTLAHASSHGQSIEEAARQLRYDWFDTLCREHGYPAVLTAHHRDDAAETFFINLLRGTGLSGLHGILHVEDVTNASLLYRRNQIRHQVLPLLRQIQPSADTAISTTIAHLQSVEQLYSALLEPLRRQLVTAGPDGTYRVSLLPFDAPGALPLADNATLRRQLLFELLRPFGFNAASVDAVLASTQPGRRARLPNQRSGFRNVARHRIAAFRCPNLSCRISSPAAQPSSFRRRHAPSAPQFASLEGRRPLPAPWHGQRLTTCQRLLLRPQIQPARKTAPAPSGRCRRPDSLDCRAPHGTSLPCHIFFQYIAFGNYLLTGAVPASPVRVA